MKYHKESDDVSQAILDCFRRRGCFNESGNDKWAIDMIFRGKHNGYFVEAGAAEGTFEVGGSSTYILERDFGWAGICIEPNATLFQMLIDRRKCICENLALFGHSGEIDFVDNSHGLGAIPSCAYMGHMEVIKNDPVIKVRCETLQEVLRRNNAPKIMDLLALDTEGSERSILTNFPFKEYRFRAVCVESCSVDDIFFRNGYITVENPYKPKKVNWERYFIDPTLL